MVGAVSICHYGFEIACISKFPTWNGTAGVQVLCACAIPLPSSLSVCDVHSDNGDSEAESTLCSAICKT